MTGVVVELCGLPGSGKSTLAASAREALLERGVPARIVDAEVSADVARPLRVARRAGLALAEAGRHPRRAAAAGGLVRSARQGSVRDTAAVLVQWLAVQRLLARARGGQGVQLIEEGPLQTLWTLGLRSSAADDARLTDSVDAAARPDLLVVVDAPLDVVLGRLGHRASRHSRTQQLARDAQQIELERGQALLTRLVGHAGVPTRTIRNDGSVPLSILAREVAQACQTLVSSTGTENTTTSKT